MADTSGAMVISPSDRDYMIRTVIGEAGSDPSASGVANVIANRMRKFGQSAKNVVLAPNQFEPWSTRANELLSYAPNSAPYQNAAKVVDGVLSGNNPDPTGGAMQFYAPKAQAALGRAPPEFENGTGVQIGAHRFFGGQPVATTDWLGQAAGTVAPPAAKTVAPPASKASAPPAGAASAPVAATPSPQSASPKAPAPTPVTDWLAKSVTPVTTPSSAASVAAAQPNATPQSPDPVAPPGVRAGDLVTPQFQLHGFTPSAPVNDTIDPYMPLTQQLGTAARNTVNYLGGQAAGLPDAIKQDWQNSGALADRGFHQMAAGSYLPQTPTTDPKTWTAGGLTNALAGTAGKISAPLTGFMHQFVGDPVTQGTGSPAIGAGAEVVADSIGGPLAARALGAGASAIGRGASAGMFGTPDAETAQLAQLARQKYNIPVTAPQMSPMNSVTRIGASALDRLPFSGAGAARAQQMAAFHSGIANEIGQPGASSLTPAVMNAARTDIGNDFETVARNTTLKIDPKFVQDLHDTLNRANATLTEPEANIITKQAVEILKKIDQRSNTIDGDTYLALTKHNAPLNDLMNSDNSNISNAAKGLDNALDSVLARSAAPQYQDMLSTARRRWAALKTVEPLAAKTAPSGEISPALLASRVNAQTGNGMAYGWGGNMGELAAIGKKFLTEPGSSNTAERLLTYSGLGGAAGDAYRLVSGAMSPTEVLNTAIGVPAGLAAGRAVSSTLRSNALANGVINRSLPTPQGPIPMPGISGRISRALNNVLVNPLSPTGVGAGLGGASSLYRHPAGNGGDNALGPAGR